jgi:hypothetical protein
MRASTAVANPSTPWIISRGQDLVWIQGSALAGCALLLVFMATPELNAGNYTAVQPAVLVLLLWGVLFDGTHVFATYARTYCAADAQSRAALPGPGAWWLLALGPGVALLDHALCKPAPSLVGHAGQLFGYFLVGAYLWAYYHLIRQHYGFLSLYRRKSDDHSMRADAAFLWAGCLYPFARFSLSDAYLASGLPHVLPVIWFDAARTTLDTGFVLFLTGLALFAVKHCGSAQFKLAPKHLFLLIVVGFHILVFSLLNNLLTITATLTIFHNLQYHRIVWLYERGKNRVPLGNIYWYLIIGLAFGVFWYAPRTLGVAMAQTDLIRNMLLGLGWGIAFHHYFVDARIWRVRRTPAIAETLDEGAKP